MPIDIMLHYILGDVTVTHLMAEENMECVLSGRVADFLRYCALVSKMP